MDMPLFGAVEEFFQPSYIPLADGSTANQRIQIRVHLLRPQMIAFFLLLKYQSEWVAFGFVSI